MARQVWSTSRRLEDKEFDLTSRIAEFLLDCGAHIVGIRARIACSDSPNAWPYDIYDEDKCRGKVSAKMYRISKDVTCCGFFCHVFESLSRYSADRSRKSATQGSQLVQFCFPLTEIFEMAATLPSAVFQIRTEISSGEMSHVSVVYPGSLSSKMFTVLSWYCASRPYNVWEASLPPACCTKPSTRGAKLSTLFVLLVK